MRVPVAFGPFPDRPTEPLLKQLHSKLDEVVGRTLFAGPDVEEDDKGFKVMFVVEVEDPALDPDETPLGLSPKG